MTTREDVQAWLDRLKLPVESVAEDLWLIRTDGGAELAVNFAPPVLVLRMRVMQLPAGARAGELFRTLLEFNARDRATLTLPDGRRVPLERQPF